MYLWVVLTTFLAMLAAYVLPIREDTQKMLTVPVAQAKLAQLVVKQNAAKQYIKQNSWPYWGGAANEYERRVNFQSSVLGADKLNAFLPVGFINNEDFVTVIYCMDENLTAIKAGTEGCRRTEAAKNKRLLITFGAIPERWQTIEVNDDGSYSVWPAPDMMGALREQFATKTMAGYVEREGNKLYIVNYERARYEIPAPVVNDASIAVYSVKDCLDDYQSCLAFMSWQ